MSDTALAYFAGLVDGEGCICIKRVAPSSLPREERKKLNKWHQRVSPTYVFSLTIEMADPRGVDDFCAHFGLRKTFSSSRLRTKPTYRAMHVAHVGGPRGVTILKALLPYLRCKREEAEVAIAFYEQTVAEHLRLGRGVSVPADKLAQRHDFYLRLQALKVLRHDGLGDSVKNA